MPFSTEPWDGSASRWPDAASYCRSCLVDNNPAGAEKTKSECHFPVKAPGSDAFNVNALRAVVGGRGAQANFPGAEAARARARRLLAEFNSTRAEAATGITFVEDEEVAASFSVDAPRRIIQGLIVPWGKVASAMGTRWRFDRGSLHWSNASRVKLNTHHDKHNPIAKAINIIETPVGLDATFKVARGDEGDKALALAEDGVLDGFSVEVDFVDGDGYEPDPQDRSVRLVRSGTLKGVALTGNPAYDDARVERVAATREGGEMSEEETVQLDGEQAAATFETALERLAGSVVESHNKLTTDLTQSVGESIAAGVKVALEEISAGGGPESVRAARYSVIREEPVYRFDGLGESIVRDSWKAVVDRGTATGDAAAERINKFRRQVEEVAELAGNGLLQFAPQSTSTASQIIPPGYRPDLYVSELNRMRPMVALTRQASIPNATPFAVPVFSSSTGVSADHVEGTNPTDGSLTFTTRTVTPQGISGRLVLTRELVDSSNPAIDQIAFNTMRESYARQTETKLYTLLNGTSGAGGVITGDFVPSGAQASTTAGGTDNQTLVKHIRERLAKYSFNRFAQPTAATMGQGATVRLATAVDTTQRPLFPFLGPQNAVGTGNTQAGSWLVDGLGFTPAWANTGVAAGDSQILIWNDNDVYVWESPTLAFRFEEKQGPANIELNIFGYFATHLLRPVGLSGIRIT